jgi:hypothetical protein
MEASILQLATPLAGSPGGGVPPPLLWLMFLARKNVVQCCKRSSGRGVRGKNDALKHDLDQLSISRDT